MVTYEFQVCDDPDNPEVKTECSVVMEEACETVLEEQCRYCNDYDHNRDNYDHDHDHHDQNQMIKSWS